MRAVVITRPGGPEVLELQELERPEPAADQVLVRVRAAGLNRADLLQRAGGYPAPAGSPAQVAGLEFAGVVEAVGPLVTAWAPGARVCGIVGGGAHAEYLLTHERMLVAVPDNLDDLAAAAVPEVFITAHDALFSQAGLTSGERVLIHAVGSGVGTAAVQLARAAGAQVFGTARDPAKLERARELGLHVALAADGFGAAVAAHTGGAGVQVLLDVGGGPYLAQNLAALALRGRMVLVGTLGGSRAEIDLGVLLGKRLRLFGTVLRSRPLEQKIAATQLFVAQVLPLLERGVVRPVVDRTFPLGQVREAHAYMAANSNFGKIILVM
jgi:putative PIG3 family NAD(P)H quinone oxidoreductase